MEGPLRNVYIHTVWIAKSTTGGFKKLIGTYSIQIELVEPDIAKFLPICSAQELKHKTSG